MRRVLFVRFLPVCFSLTMTVLHLARVGVALVAGEAPASAELAALLEHSIGLLVEAAAQLGE